MMMTNKKDAIKYFKSRIKLGQCGKGTTQREAMEMAIEALEKQVPQEPKLDDEMGFFECTACGGLIGYMEDPKSHKYCLMCGQALSWEEE